MPENLTYLRGVNARAIDKADAIAQDSATVMYLGFCLPRTTGTDAATWSICKIESSGTGDTYVQTVKWVQGTDDYRFVFDDRATYEYLFKKFV